MRYDVAKSEETTSTLCLNKAIHGTTPNKAKAGQNFKKSDDPTYGSLLRRSTSSGSVMKNRTTGTANNGSVTNGQISTSSNSTKGTNSSCVNGNNSGSNVSNGASNIGYSNGYHPIPTSGAYPAISAAYWLPAPNPQPYLVPGK